MAERFELTPEQIAAARVVIVDDEAMVTDSLASFLSLELDVEPITFNDPTEALAYIREHEVDLVLSDFLMPEMDGIKFLIEARNNRPGVPRVLLTGYADKQNAITAINEVKLFQYMQKPWDNEALKAVVLDALRQLWLMRRLAETLEELAQTRTDIASMRTALLEALA